MPAPPRPEAPDAETAQFRRVLGHFCTGVTVITGVDDGRPAGFACQAFAALSLTPPLVLFCPGTSSRTWPVIANSGYFCVNVLSAGQQDIARRFGVSGADKFAGLSRSPSSSGAPVLAGKRGSWPAVVRRAPPRPSVRGGPDEPRRGWGGLCLSG